MTETHSAKERRLTLATGWTAGLLTAVGVASVANGAYILGAIVLAAPLVVLAYELKWSLQTEKAND